MSETETISAIFVKDAQSTNEKPLITGAPSVINSFALSLM